MLRCVDYRSAVAGPPLPGADAAEAPPGERPAGAHVVVPAEPQLAKLHARLLREADSSGGPRHSFCVPHVPDFCVRRPEAWERSLQAFLTAGKAKFKKLQVADQQAILSFEAGASDDDGESNSSEEDDAALLPEPVEIEEEASEPEPVEGEAAKEEPKEAAEGQAQADPAAEESSRSSDSESGSAEEGDEAEGERPRKKKRREGEAPPSETALATLEGAQPAEESDADLEMERELEKALQSSKGTKKGQAELTQGQKELLDKDSEGPKQKKPKMGKEKSKEKAKKKADKDKSKRSRSRRKHRSRSRKRSPSSERKRSRSRRRRHSRSRSSDRRSRSRSRSGQRPGQQVPLPTVLQVDVDNFVAKCAADQAATGLASEQAATQPASATEADGTPLAQLLRGTMPQTESSTWKDLQVPKPTLETAFEEMSESQKERQRRRLERLKSVQGGAAGGGGGGEPAPGAANAAPLAVKEAGEGKGKRRSVLAKLKKRAAGEPEEEDDDLQIVEEADVVNLESEEEEEEEKKKKQKGEGGELAPGKTVEAYGLESESGQHLNGQRGVIARFLDESGRFEVRFSEDKVVALKPANLRLLRGGKRPAEAGDEEAAGAKRRAATEAYDPFKEPECVDDEALAQQPREAAAEKKGATAEGEVDLTGEAEGKEEAEEERPKVGKEGEQKDAADKDGAKVNTPAEEKDKEPESEDEEAVRDRLLEEQELGGKSASEAESGKGEAGKAEAGKAEDGKAKDGKAKDGKTEDGKAEDGKAESGKAEDEKAPDGKATAGQAEVAAAVAVKKEVAEPRPAVKEEKDVKDKPGVKKEELSECKTEVKSEVKEEPKAKAKEEPKAEAKEEPKAEAKEEPKSEGEDEKADSKVKLEPKEEPRAEEKEPKAEVSAGPRAGGAVGKETAEKAAAAKDAGKPEVVAEPSKAAEAEEPKAAPASEAPKAAAGPAQEEKAVRIQEQAAAGPAKEERAAADREQDLESLPVVELRRQLRAKGVDVPSELQDKDELVELLRVAKDGKKPPAKAQASMPVDDAFAAFLQEIGGAGDDVGSSAPAPPAATPAKEAAKESAAAAAEEAAKAPVDLAFEAFLQELDFLPGGDSGEGAAAETGGEAGGEVEAKEKEQEKKSLDPDAVQPTAEQPLLMRFVARRRAWIVARLGREEKVFSLDEEGPIEACKKASDYHREQEAEVAAEKAGNVLVDAPRDGAQQTEKALSPAPGAGKPICRDLDFAAMRLLARYGGGKRTFTWPVGQELGGEGYGAEAEKQCELSRPIHPFQLQWRVGLHRYGASSSPHVFGAADLWSPAGLVASCPSKSRLAKLRQLQAEREEEQSELQRRLQLEHQARITAAVAAASNPLEATMAMQMATTQTAASMAAVSALAERPVDVSWTRRLERLAVFSGARGCEHAPGFAQLEGLTVLPDEDGSNALPVLLLLAFLRPHSAGSARGSCAALCDLDSLHVRAVSLFGPAEESRWVLPVSKRRRLTLDDLQRANALRAAVSKAFGLVEAEEPEDGKAAAGPAGTIREDVEICRALGELVSLLGGGPSPSGAVSSATGAEATEEAAAQPASASAPAAAPTATASSPGQAEGHRPRRELGDVWIDLEEAGARYEEAAGAGGEAAGAGGRKRPAEGGGPFFSFDVSVEELAQAGGAEPEAEAEASSTAEATVPAEPRGFALLPELTLRGAVLERAASYRRMQAEARELASLARQDAKAAGSRLRELQGLERQLAHAPERARGSWDLAMGAEGRGEVDEAMQIATSIMQEVNRTVSALIEGSDSIGTLHTTALERERRCAEGERRAPRFWTAAAAAARRAAATLGERSAKASEALQAAEAPKALALRKADNTVKLINEKLTRWADEQRILREEARTAERARVAQAQQAAAEELRKQQAELQKQQEEMMQRREAAIQWGRNLVEPMPNLIYAPSPSAAASAGQHPPPQPLGPPPPGASPPPGPPPGPPPPAGAAPAGAGAPPGPPPGPPPRQDRPLATSEAPPRPPQAPPPPGLQGSPPPPPQWSPAARLWGLGSR